MATTKKNEVVVNAVVNEVEEEVKMEKKSAKKNAVIVNEVKEEITMENTKKEFISITDKYQYVAAIAAKDEMAAAVGTDQYNDPKIPEPIVQPLPNVDKETAALGMFCNMIDNIPENVKSAAFSVPSCVFPRIREAQKGLEQGMAIEDVKSKVVKAWMFDTKPLLADTLEEMVEILSSIEIPFLVIKNFNAYKWVLDPIEAYAAGLKHGQELEFKDSVAKVGDKEVHVVDYKHLNGKTKVVIDPTKKIFKNKNGEKGRDMAVLRNEKPDIALENLRDLVDKASKALYTSRARRIKG